MNGVDINPENFMQKKKTKTMCVLPFNIKFDAVIYRLREATGR